MLKNLFGSQIRVDLLGLFLLHPGEEFYMRQIIADLGAPPQAVQRELANLADIGLVHKRVSGKQHYFGVSEKHPLYAELRDIFVKTVGLRDVFVEKLKPVADHLDYCFIYGSMARGDFKPDSDIDLLLIGAVSSRQLASLFADMSAQMGREVNYAVFPVQEIENRLKAGDHFLSSLLNEPMLFITGQEHEFRNLAQEWLAQAAPNQS